MAEIQLPARLTDTGGWGGWGGALGERGAGERGRVKPPGFAAGVTTVLGEGVASLRRKRQKNLIFFHQEQIAVCVRLLPGVRG